MTKVFVYGSFMKKRRYHQHYLHGQKFLGDAFINDYKSYILGGLDGIRPEKGGRVPGEVYEVDPSGLAKLDFVHNLGTMFHRELVDVELENGESAQVETYIWNG